MKKFFYIGFISILIILDQIFKYIVVNQKIVCENVINNILNFT